MKYNQFDLQKIREIPIFKVCECLNIPLHGRGALARRALCWYHEDTHPSMQINKEKNIFKCFVCGKGGDVIRLVQDYKNISFLEACDWLAEEFSIVQGSGFRVIDEGRTASLRKTKDEGRCLMADGRGLMAEVGSLMADGRGLMAEVGSLMADGRGLMAEVGSLMADGRNNGQCSKETFSIQSDFCKSAVYCGYLTEGEMLHAAERYRLGLSEEGGVIFWEIDAQQRVRTGKVMFYLSDCHRDKSHTPTWVHSLLKDKLPANFTLQHCLFGEHLLAEPSEVQKKIAIVESEKTAVILSEKFTDFIWLSCGGLQMFKPQLLEPLLQYRIIIFPDTDSTGDTFIQWSEVCREAQRLYRFRYPIHVSPILEMHATPEQKQRKIDILDYVV